MSDFSALNTALTGLRASQRALGIIGQNVTNANTDGYSREELILEGIGGVMGPSLWTNNSTLTGSGVQVAGVQRFRAAYLEVNGAFARGAQSELALNSQALAGIESIFGEPSEDSLSSSLTDLWAGFADVANNPNDPGARQQLLSRAASVASAFNGTASRLAQLRTNSIGELGALVPEINNAAATIASLNSSIAQATLQGNDPSALEDQRDALAQQLASDVGATIRPGDNGAVNVFVGGTALVSGTRAETLALDTSGPTVTLNWVGSGHPASMSTGSAGGLLNTINSVVPSYQQSLDAVAVKLRDDINAIHSGGVGLDGGTGRNFFDGTGAADLAVSADIAGQPDKIAAGAVGAGQLDGSVALSLSDLGASATGADSLYRSLVARMGVESQSAQRSAAVQDQTVAQIDASRQSISGVNTDEEMVAMVQFQHMYDASARYLTAIDQMLDTLVNRTGVVGM